jgi:formate hydrogenlyase subunit 3/multisubunit Na+/H+ antiporter MnhD subunit
MSGVMIKTGIYGILRMLTFLGPPPVWWGWMFVALGATSGVCGVLFALAQHDLKRLLAYHSVENIGIIVIGIGVGLTGLSAGSPAVAALGFAGALLHVINHAMFKGLLFLGAGSVYHGTHTLEIDRLGGLIKRMPWTASFFLVGAAAISGLPPLNGFVSEFLIYLGSFRGTVSLAAAGVVPLVCSIAALGLIGGLAAACFTKAFGIVFLGEPRASEAGEARESPRSMIVPMGVLAAGCLAVGLLGPWVISATYYPIAALAGNDAGGDIVQASASLRWVVTGSIVLIGLAALCAGVRYLLLRGRQVSSTVTWDCGYAAPSPRMQYTASSFAQPVMDLFRFFLRTTKHTKPLEAYFPASSHMDTETPDTWHEEMYRPLFAAARRLLSRLRVLQHGRIQIYVLYVVITLFVLLVWTLR